MMSRRGESGRLPDAWDDLKFLLIMKWIGGNVTEKITPETYEKMNEEFEEEGLAFRIIVPTQEEIDDWQQRN